jgi:precorrin-6Y C5,15-methyltransferase (decarboxylating)
MIAVVGIGADGWDGLGEDARAAVMRARTLVGSRRQLELIPPAVGGDRQPWPSPLEPLLEQLAAMPSASSNGGRQLREPVCVLASGDPMLHGIGATLARRLGPERLAVYPHASAFALACARLGWPEAEVELVSAVGRPLEALAALLQPRRRLIVYAAGADGAAAVAAAVRERGFGPSRFVVLEQLGGPRERLREATAASWGDQRADPLHAVAIECRAEPGARALARVPGLPDCAYDHDGQLTKWPARAVALAALAPAPRELLWDVGAGAGSIAIEWLRAEPLARAVAIECKPERAARIAANARRLGVPALEVVCGRAPEVLAGLPRPDAIFAGGGVSADGLLDACWQALAPGGRIVAHAVTLEGEQALARACALRGGSLLRLEVSQAGPLGGYQAWRPALPLVQWRAAKEGQS